MAPKSKKKKDTQSKAVKHLLKLLPELKKAEQDMRAVRGKYAQSGYQISRSTSEESSVTDMMVELEQLVAWWPPEDLRKDGEEWFDRCKLCPAAPR